MSYSSELKQLKQQQLYQHTLSADVIDSISSFMSATARRENAQRNQSLLDFYDIKISHLEPLAQQEQEEWIINAVINAVANQDNYISGTIEKSLEDALKSL